MLALQNTAKNCENQTYIKEQLSQFYNIIDYHVFCQSYRLAEHQLATQSFCFHLNFIHGCNPNLVKKIKYPLFDNGGERLILANHSLKQLNIINNRQHRGSLSSVSNFINKCKTPMGKRKLHNMLIHPTNNSKWLNKQYEIIKYVIDNYDKFSDIRKKLTEIGDIERLYRKLILHRVAPAELSQFYQNLRCILNIYTTLNDDEKINNYINNPNLSKNCSELMKILDDNLLLTESAKISSIKFDVNIFKRDKYPTLDKLEKEYVESKDKLECIRIDLERFIIKYKSNRTNTMVRYHETDKNGLFLSMTNKRSKILQEELKKADDKITLNYVSSYDSTTGQLTFEPRKIQYIKHTKNNLRLDSSQLNKMYASIFTNKEILKDELSDIYKEFINLLQNYSEQIENIVKYVTELDLVITKAYLAIKYNYCMPKINNEASHSFLQAKNMRHPLIEHLQQEEYYVPNDIDLGFDTEQRGILLYGTNAVGKSSLIRSIGICVIMAQAGLFVPCSEFIYKPYKSIFTRILGNDDLFK